MTAFSDGADGNAEHPVFDTGAAAVCLRDSVIATFASLAFIDVMPAGAPADNAVFDHTVSIDILKPFSARILLLLPGALKEKISLNIYPAGAGEANSGEKEDCLLEILNVLTGNFMHACFGENVPYLVELPQLRFDGENDAADFLAVADLDAEGLPLKAVLKTVRYWY